ncbi:hypothetical protein [Verrucomicrobium spinosum]|uniref:hypothetical protein n=1 Tax=Verrucomicrobium spinosum TaxID=2736 RepID=UPI0009463DA6|nr:hypothetical protein [Verrucomicrobium spinosum]
MPALWVLVTWVAILPLPALHSQFTTLWSIGVENNDPQELGGETWPQNNLPGSATALDNDYYFAGTYGIGTVAATEAASQFERVLSTTNHTQRIHFNLNAGQATTTARIRFHFNQVWGGWWQATTNTQGPGYGNHSLEVRLNGALIGTKLFTTRGEMLVEANAGTFTLATGENVLEITRVTTSPSSPDGASSSTICNSICTPLRSKMQMATACPGGGRRTTGSTTRMPPMPHLILIRTDSRTYRSSPARHSRGTPIPTVMA